MKRILCMLLALVMLGLCLASCQKEVPTDPAESLLESQGASDSESESEEPLDNYVEMITYNIAYYEATAKNMTVYYENQGLEDYTIARRAVRLESLVDYFMPDVLALQEVNRVWWPYIISNEDSIVKEYGYDWEGRCSTYNNKSGTDSVKADDL